ncbi:MAG: NnrU family protein [Parvularculaceae bacterium]|nr:NnrU family protein [Parvularculaceae bacterium]
MALFFLGLIVFFGSHLYTALARKSREGLVARLGAGPYKGLYSLVSIAGFALIIIGWRSADASLLYTPPEGGRAIAYLLTFFAFVLLAAAYAPKGKIAAAIKHPMLAGVKAWAFAHLLVNGEVRSVLLFGAFLAYGVIDRIAVKRRGDNGPAPGPFRNDLIAIAVGTAAWAAVFLWLHPYIAGVALQ